MRKFMTDQVEIIRLRAQVIRMHEKVSREREGEREGREREREGRGGERTGGKEVERRGMCEGEMKKFMTDQVELMHLRAPVVRMHEKVRRGERRKIVGGEGREERGERREERGIEEQ